MCFLFGKPANVKAEVSKEVAAQLDEVYNQLLGTIQDRCTDLESHVEVRMGEILNEAMESYVDGVIKQVQETVDKYLSEKVVSEIERKLKLFVTDKMDTYYESQQESLQINFDEYAKETEERLTRHLGYVIKDYERHTASALYEELYKSVYDKLFKELCDKLTKDVLDSVKEPTSKSPKYLGEVKSPEVLDALSFDETLNYGDYCRVGKTFTVGWVVGDDGSVGEQHYVTVEEGDFLVVSEGFEGDIAQNLEESYLRYWSIVRPERKA